MRHALLFLLLTLWTTTLRAAEENVSIESSGCTLFGTLATPADDGDTAILIIAGSGPTDRNGNNPLGVGARSYALIADLLADEGFASLRYDKRGIGASELSREKLEKVVLEDFIGDARRLARYLKHERGYARVVLLGHSEGALIALAAAGDNPDVDAVVSLCGPGQPLDALIKKQIGRQTGQLGLTKTLEIYGILDSLKTGRVPRHIPADLERMLFPRAVLPFLISAMRYDPAQLAARLRKPLLIVGGENDIQVGPEQAEMLKLAQPTAEMAVVEKMTHVLKSCDTTDSVIQILAYQNGDLPLSPGLKKILLDYLKRLHVLAGNEETKQSIAL